MSRTWKGRESITKDPDERDEGYRKSWKKPTVGTCSSAAAGTVSTAACSTGSFSPETAKSLTELEDFLVGKLSRGFSPDELIARGDGRTRGRVGASSTGRGRVGGYIVGALVGRGR